MGRDASLLLSMDQASIPALVCVLIHDRHHHRSFPPFHRYLVDIDLKKLDEKDVDKKELKKFVRKTFEERYMDQGSSKSERKSQGTSYFYKKLRF